MSIRSVMTRAIAATTLATGLAAVGMTAANAAGMTYVSREPSYMHCKVKQWSVLNQPDTTLVRDCTDSNGQWYFTTDE